MRLIGLTGGYASGKTLVASTIERLGGRVIDLDQVSRDLCRPGGIALPPLREAFGEEVFNPDGTLDRKALGHLVFNDADALIRLEEIMHPLMRDESLERATALYRDDPTTTVVVDGALLIEGGWYRVMEKTILVTCPEEERIRRGMTRDRLTEEEVRRRLAAQWPDHEKLTIADYPIDNGGTIEETVRQVEALWPLIVENGESSPHFAPTL